MGGHGVVRTHEGVICRLAVLSLRPLHRFLPSEFAFTLYSCCCVPAGQALDGLICVNTADTFPNWWHSHGCLKLMFYARTQLLHA